MSFRTPTRLALGLLVGAALFGGTLEVAARALLASPAGHARLNNGGPEARKLVSLEAARVLGDRGKIHIGDVLPDPDLGWVLAPGAQQALGGITSDAAQHRVTRPPDRVLAPETPRVWLLGDSFTLGLEVKDEQTWAWQLQARTDAEVVNGAVHGYGLDQVVLHFERDGAPQRPALVVLGKDDPMLMRTALQWDAWAKPWFTLEAGQLVVHGQPTPTPEQALAAAPWSRALAMWPVVRETYLERHAGEYSADLATALFRRLHEDVTRAGGRLVLLQLPTTTSLTPDGEPRQDTRLYAAWCADPTVICVDATPAVRETVAAREPVVSGVHWSPEVHTRAAALVADALLTAGLLPPRGTP